MSVTDKGPDERAELARVECDVCGALIGYQGSQPRPYMVCPACKDYPACDSTPEPIKFVLPPSMYKLAKDSGNYNMNDFMEQAELPKSAYELEARR